MGSQRRQAFQQAGGALKLAPWVLVVGLLVAMVALRGFGGGAVQRALQRAETAETAVRSLTVARDGLTTANEALTASVAASDASYAEAEARRQAESMQAVARAAEARARASGLADDLRAQLDSVGRAQLDRFEAEWRVVLEATEAQVVVLGAQVTDLEGLVAGRDALILRLRSEITAGLAVESGLRDANDALHDAIRAQRLQTWAMRGATALLLVGAVYQAAR